MSQVVQAKCPHCQNVLRIPAEWADKEMRCKNCKQTFQAKVKTSSNVAAGAPKAQANVPIAQSAKPKSVPVAQPAKSIPIGIAAGAPPQSTGGSPFGFDDNAQPPSIARRRGRGRGMLLLVVMFFFLFLFAAGAAGFVVYKAMNNELPDLLEPSQPIARGDGKKSENNPVRPPTDGANDKKKANTDDSKKDKDGAVTEPPPKKTPPKKNPPKKEPPKTDVPKKDPPKDGDVVKKELPKKPPLFTNDPFPRRALLVSVNNYLFYNTVHYGNEAKALRADYPGSSTGVLRDRFSRPPLNFPATQVYELSDGVPPELGKPHSTQKSVIQDAIKDFVADTRAQDRVVILFAGHAAAIEDKAYLIPSDGDVKDVASLVPLKWVYDQLAACKAQQKILILDVFRYSPSRGSDIALTGDGDEGTLPKAFEMEIMSPPDGVQVWSACSKHQNKDNKDEEIVYESSIELEGGSAFLQALCASLQGGPKMDGISNPTQPIPIDALQKDVNERLKGLLMPEKRTQVSMLTGKASDKVIDYDKDEPLPVALKLKPPTAGGAMAASKEDVNSILEFFRELPQVRETRAGDKNLLSSNSLPAFSAKKIESYKTDKFKDFADLQSKFKADKMEFAKEYPLRAAIVEAVEALQESNKIRMREVLSKADTDPKRKAAMRLEQEPLGMSEFKLQRALTNLKIVGEKREMETSRRWQANFDYTQARLQSRVVYLIEYNYLLGRVLADDLPELAPGQTGWRIGSGKKIAVTERKAKDLAKDTKKLWDKIVADYPDTPWALLASREKDIALGLQWRPKSD